MPRSFQETASALSAFIVPGRAGQGVATLDDVGKVCTMLGIDLGKLSAIHIAGTKGKGSTSAMTERLLRGTGVKTGLFTSPHLVDVRERIRINGRVLDKEVFARYFWEVHDVVSVATAEANVHLHYFHFLTVLGFFVFQREQVDVAIMEVGLGGRLDSTNVLPRPVVCGVTLLDLDHVAILGNTLALIAGEKAGIIKKGVPAVTTSVQPPEGLAVLAQHARTVSAPLFLAPPLDRYSTTGPVHLGLQGDFQRHNAALALALVRIWAARVLPCSASPSFAIESSIESWAANCRTAWGNLEGSVVAAWHPASAPPITAAALQRANCAADKQDGIAAAEATAVTPGAAIPALAEFERTALAAARWPARAQVFDGGAAGGVVGGLHMGRVCIHLDGKRQDACLCHLASVMCLNPAPETPTLNAYIFGACLYS